MVKLEYEDQEIIVHGEDEQSIYWDPSVPCLEAREGSEHIVYQVFEVVVADQYEEGSPCPQPFLSKASVMVAKEMIRHSYKPGKGLGASLQGITEPITLLATKKFFDVGFHATEADVTWANQRKSNGWLTSTREHIFKLLKKDAVIKWTDECQEAFDKIKEYLSNPPVLVPPEPGRPLFLYLTVLENSFGCVLKQHDVTRKREQAIYYLSKKFTSYEAKYTLLERTCCALTWVAQKLRHYLLAYTTYLITRLDPLKYIFQKPMPTGRLAKWQILLIEFDIVYVTRTAIKAQALADHLAENPVDDEYQPLSTYFPDEEVNSIDMTSEDTSAWKMFFDGAVNTKGVGIGAILISPTGQHYPATARLRRFKSIEFRYIPRCHNELADALTTLASMLPYPGNAHIDPLEIQIRERHDYCNTAEAEPSIQPWYHDIKRFLKTKEYPEQASGDQKRTIRRYAIGFFLSGDVLYKRTLDLNLLRCVAVKEAGRIMYDIHAGVCGPHMNGYVLAKKIL
ncbi:uncharacterized protein [Nicotiana sylvestris]|uniref:uncharacterized protein n=1 Tax=Nicotiana sylvestris TaxID=4096 RepID=UPI00388C6B63